MYDDEVILEVQQIGAQVLQSEHSLARGNYEYSVRPIAEGLIHTITGQVLAHDSGAPQTVIAVATATVNQKIKPWWIPKFLWNRIEEKPESVTERTVRLYQPKWIYPESTIDLTDKLGQPVRLLHQTPLTYK